MKNFGQPTASGSAPVSAPAKRPVPVLLYHRIITESVQDDWANIAVHEKVFRRHIELLDRWGYTAITFRDYLLSMKGALDLPKRPVIITFDDAYEEVYTVAKPILEQYAMRSVVFVVGDVKMRESVWDKGKGKVFRLLTDQQIIELNRDGHEIGSHSMSHPDLTSLPESEVWQELMRSRMLLEITLNAPVQSFAYPYGLVDERVKWMTREAGYLFACAAYTGPSCFGADLFEIRRVKVLDTANPFMVRMMLHPWYTRLRWVWWRWKRLRRTPARAAHTPSSTQGDEPSRH